MALEQGKQTIVIENLFGGWAHDLSSSNSAAVKSEESQYSQYTGQYDKYSKSSSIALFRPGQDGNIAPGLVFASVADASNQVNGLALNADVDSSLNAYCLLNGYLLNGTGTCSIVRFAVGTNSIDEYHGIQGTATVTTVNGDLVNMYSLTGTPPSATTEQYVFYSYEWGTPTAGDVGRRVKSSGVYSDNYLSSLTTQSNGTALFPNVPHPLAIGVLEKLIIGNGRYVAMHDPTTTTVEYQALDLKAGFTITSLARYQNFNAIIAYRSNSAGLTKGECMLFLWDGFSPSWNYQYPLRDFKSATLFNDAGDLYVFSSGLNNTTKLWKFNGSGFDLMYESAQIGSAPGRGGVDKFYNNIAWSGSGILAYGEQGGLHNISGGSTNPGMCKTLYQNTLYVGNNSNGVYSIQYATPDGYATSAYLRTKLYELPTNSTITNIRVYFSSLGSGAQVTFSLFKDYTTTAIGGANDLLNYTIDNATYGNTNYHSIQRTIDNVNSFFMQLTFSSNTSTTAAIIRKIEVDYQVDANNI